MELGFYNLEKAEAVLYVSTFLLNSIVEGMDLNYKKTDFN